MLEEIRDTKSSLWISASAGTGKTKNLVDRILALLINGVEPSQILCLTYTKAAANEMLERLSAYFEKMHNLSDQEVIAELKNIGFSQNYLKRVRELYEKIFANDWVNIQTIHSFSLNLLKKFPLETGFYPGVKLCDDNQKKQLLEDSFDFVLSQKNLFKHLKILSRYTSSILDLLQDSIIIKVRKFLSLYPTSTDIQNFFVNFFEIDENFLRMNPEDALKIIREKSLGKNYKKQFLKVIEILKTGGKTDCDKANCLQQTLDTFSEDFIFAVFTKELKETSSLCSKKIESEFLKSELLNIRKKAENYLEEKSKFLTVSVNISFFCVLKILLDKFSELKMEQHFIDYDDIILQTLNLLKYSLPWVLYKIDKNISHILVDEAQDTSPEQWAIIDRLTSEFFANYKSEKTIFVVGDEKQSIYSFQGADVELFEKMHELFKKYSENCGQKFSDVILNKSYRSEGNILSFVDKVFESDFNSIKHETTKTLNGGVIEIADLFEDENDSDETKNSSKKSSEYIADFIEEKIKNRIAVKDNSRSARPGDFLILFRHRDLDEMNAICDELKKRKIPVSGIDRILLKDEIVAEDLLALAEFKLFPLNDLICACVLKSPIVGISEEDLMQICLDRNEKNLWTYILERKDFCEKYQLDILQKYLDLDLSCFDFFSYVLMDGVREKFINRLGPKCLNILDELLNICSNFEKDYSPNLSNFLKWFRKNDQTIKKDLLGNKNEVRIMTVHASKGLQAPFVILADAHFEPKNSNSIIANDDDELFWNFDKKSAPKYVKTLIEKNENYKNAEAKRLLYVAMTRAENYLCVFGKKGTKEIPKNCWYNKIKNCSENFVRDGNILRLGNYSKFLFEEKSKIENEITLEKIPNWYYEKISEVEKNEIYEDTKNRQTEFGDCVHLLLKNFSDFKNISQSYISNFELTDEEKNEAMQTAIAVIKNFPQLFGEKSKSEVTVFFDRKEYRIDKIAEIDGQVWIIDFKTGTPHETIPQEYEDQLKLYQKIHKKITNVDAKIAILWTRDLKFVEIF